MLPCSAAVVGIVPLLAAHRVWLALGPSHGQAMPPLLARIHATLTAIWSQAGLKAAKGVAMPKITAAGRTMSCKVRRFLEARIDQCLQLPCSGVGEESSFLRAGIRGNSEAKTRACIAQCTPFAD